MASSLDVCIRGSGIVGRTLALLLAREQLRVGLVSSPPPEPDRKHGADVRAYALNHASRTLLESVRGWPAGDAATAVTRMQVHGDRRSEVNFDASSLETGALTWIVDVPALESQLQEAVRYQPQIEVLETPSPAKLTVICEGRGSSTRSEFGVDFEVTPYAQHALAARLRCGQTHGQVARQWFYEGNILALLPMGGAEGNSVAVVWSIHPDHAQRLKLADEADFCRELESVSQGALGAVQLESDRQVWPLQRAQARQWSGHTAGGAWVLAGDAAHNVHPLAGQGLNLGLADAAELQRVLRGRAYWRSVGDPRLLRQYERARKAGMLPMDTGMDALQLLFSREGEGWRSLRSIGMQAVERSHLLKRWLARQAMS